MSDLIDLSDVGYSTFTWDESTKQWSDGSKRISAIGNDKKEYIGGIISGETFPATNDNRSISASPKVSESESTYSYVIVKGTTVTGMTITNDCGSAVRTEDPKNTGAARAQIKAIDCLFSNNKSQMTGGAIDNVGGLIELYHCTIINSTSNAEAGTNTGSAVTNRTAKCTISIEGCYFKNNVSADPGAAVLNMSASVQGETGPDSATTIKDSYFLTSTDTIASRSGTITFTGTNFLGASVTQDGGSNILASGGAFAFINTSEISVTCTLQGNNRLIFNNTAAVNLSGLGIDIVTTVGDRIEINPYGLVGRQYNVASNVNYWGSTTGVVYNGYTTTLGQLASLSPKEVDLHGGTLTATAKARGMLMGETLGNEHTDYIGKTIEFDHTGYSEDLGTLHLGGDKSVIGLGVDNTTLSNAVLFTDGNDLSMSNLKFGGTIYGEGGSLNLSTLKYSGVIFGGASNTVVDSNTNSNVVLDGVEFDCTTATNRIYGSGKVTGGATLNLGTINVTAGTTSAVTLGATTSIYGAGYAKDTNSMLKTGNITLDITAVTVAGTTSGSVYGGAYVGGSQGATVDLGTITTTISGGHYKFVGNGTYALTKTVSTSVSQGASTLNIKGGIFEGYVYGGGYSRGDNNGVTVNGDCTLNITGGTFNNYVFGGCGADSSAGGNKTTINGSISVTIDGGTGNANVITFAKSVFAGSIGNGNYSGSTQVTVKGNLANIAWGTDAGLFGSNQWSRTDMTKAKTLVFDNASGSFGAVMKNTFTVAEIKSDAAEASTITFSNSVVLDSVASWTLDKDVSLVWGSTGSCNLANDTLTLKDYTVDDTAVTLFNLGSNALTGWGSQTVAFEGAGDTTKTGEGDAARYSATYNSVT